MRTLVICFVISIWFCTFVIGISVGASTVYFKHVYGKLCFVEDTL